MLDLATKASIRRHLGLPAAGIQDAGTTLGLRTVTRAGQLEKYMNVLQVEEEAILMGRAYGAFIIYTPVVNGNQYAVTIGGNTYTYVATGADVLAPDPLKSVASNIRLMLMNNLTGAFLMDYAQINAVPYYPYVSTAIQFSLQSLTGTFALSMAGGVVIADGSSNPDPQLQTSDGNGDPTAATYVYGLLPVCNALEQQMLNSTQNMTFTKVGSDTSGAALFNPQEARMRYNMLQKYRYELGVMLSFYAPNAQSGIPSFGIRV